MTKKASKEPTAPTTTPAPETLSDSKPESKPETKTTAKTESKSKIQLTTHMVFEGEAKAPEDIVEIPSADVKNWLDAGLAKLPE